MKRGGDLPRRTPLRADPARTAAWIKASRQRLPRESARRRAERPLRMAVVQQAKDRDGERCAAAELVPEVACWGGLQPHEVVPRGRRPGSHLDPDVVKLLCAAHHGWAHDGAAEVVRSRGLLLHDWDTTPGEAHE